MSAPHSLETDVLGYREALSGHIRSILRNSADAEDALQETLVRAHQTLEQLRDRAALATWLFRIATHVSLDRLRQRSRRPEAVDSSILDDEIQGDEDTTTPSLQHLIEQREMTTCVQRFLLELPDDYRTVLLLYEFEEMTATEIASVLDISLPNTKVRLHRARERLKNALLKGCTFSCDCRGVVVCEPKTSQDR